MIEIARVWQGAKQSDGDSGKTPFPFAKLAKYLAIGLEIPSTIVGAVVFGYLIDLKFGTSPWFTVASAVLGFFGAVYRLIKYLKYFSGGKHAG
jgi:F0F1-type ATP synthase assembly protein I